MHPRTISKLSPGDKVVVCSAGPAGLTAAYLLARKGYEATVVEADDEVGGLSRTIRYKNFASILEAIASSPRFPSCKRSSRHTRKWYGAFRVPRFAPSGRHRGSKASHWHVRSSPLRRPTDARPLSRPSFTLSSTRGSAPGRCGSCAGIALPTAAASSCCANDRGESQAAQSGTSRQGCPRTAGFSIQVGCDCRDSPGRNGDLVIPTIGRGHFRLRMGDFRFAIRLAKFLSWCDVPEPWKVQERSTQDARQCPRP